MLLWLTEWLSNSFPVFNVFSAITVRSVLAMLTAWGISLWLGPRVIRKLIEYKIGQSVRDDGPQTHLVKSGTPTMGGALILIAISIAALLWANLENEFIWVVLIVTLGFGIIGWIDDYRKVVYHNSKGLSAAQKYFWQSVLGLGAAAFLAYKSGNINGLSEFVIPFFEVIPFPLGIAGFVILAYFVIVGTSNAVNLTDGLDGLASLPSVLVTGALGVFAYVAGNPIFSQYLALPYVSGAGELTVLCGAIAGAGLGFLWFNAYPAQVFMGDVGALALGAAIGTIAVIVRQEIVLFVMGGLFVAETLSVMLQVTWFKLTGGKRLFRMAPLHHHFELKGWKETQVVVRFWIISILLVTVGLSTL